MVSSEDTFYNIINIITESVVIIGLIGNILTFVVFSRRKFRNNSISIYFRALAIFDSFIVLEAVINFYLIFYKYYIAQYSDTVCKLVSYSSYTFGSIPGWILIALSIEKLLSMKKVTNTMKRPFIHYSIVIAIFLFNILLYIEIPIYLKLVPIEYYGVQVMFCDTAFLWFGNVLNIVYLVNGTVLPFVIMFVTSLIMIKALRDSRRQIEAIGTSGGNRKRREIKFAVTSLAFNGSFVVLKMPLLVCLSVGLTVVDFYFLQVAVFLFYLNFSLGFFVHFIVNSVFRKELFIVFRIRKSKQQSTLIKVASQKPTQRT